MRTRAKMALVSAIAAIGLTMLIVPVASATSKPPTTRAQEKRQNKGLKKAANQISLAQSSISSLKSTSSSLSSGLSTAQSQIKSLMQVADALPAVLTQLVNGLTAINTALQNPTTGLVGLNNARPQFGVFAQDGTILGSTGLSGGSGPTADATLTSGLYVVDFGNDVSKRVYSVNVFPYVITDTPTGDAVNCSANATASTVCGSVLGESSDDSPNDVLVQVGGGSGAANGFSVTAISG